MIFLIGVRKPYEIRAEDSEKLLSDKGGKITNLFYAGADPKTVQYLAGHENSKTTMDIYAKVKYNKPEELFGVVNQAFIHDK